MTEKTDQTPEGEVKTDDQKIVIGELELTPDEAKELVEQGKTLKELKAEYPDVDFSEMPKEFTKRSQELAELKKPKPQPAPVDDAETTRLKQINDFFADPLVKEKLETFQAEKEQKIKEDLNFERTIESLESEFDGTDGRPKFDRKAVLDYGMKHQVFNPRTSYKEMHETELDEWKLKNANKARRPTTFVEKGGTGGGAKPPETKTPQTFREATNAALAQEHDN